MAGVIDDLKARARILHRQVLAGDPLALTRLRRLPELGETDPPRLGATIKRRHCLTLLARELGFDGWSHATSVLRGRKPGDSSTIIKLVIRQGRVSAQQRFRAS